MTRHMNKLQIDLSQLENIIDISIDSLKELYPELEKKKEIIKQVIIEEKRQICKNIKNGEKNLKK